MRLEDAIDAIPLDEKQAAVDLIIRRNANLSLKDRIRGALDLIVDYLDLAGQKHEFFDVSPTQIVRECMRIYSVTSADMALIPDLFPEGVR